MRFADTTRGGHPVRILCTDREGGPPITALVRMSDDRESLFTYHTGGVYYPGEESPLDLLPLTPEVGKTYDGGYYKVIAHTPDLNPAYPWVVATTDKGYSYLFRVNDQGVSPTGYASLDL